MSQLIQWLLESFGFCPSCHSFASSNMIHGQVFQRELEDKDFRATENITPYSLRCRKCNYLFRSWEESDITSETFEETIHGGAGWGYFSTTYYYRGELCIGEVQGEFHSGDNR